MKEQIFVHEEVKRQNASDVLNNLQNDEEEDEENFNLEDEIVVDEEEKKKMFFNDNSPSEVVVNNSFNNEIIDEDEVASDVISVGCHVKLLDMEFEDEMEFSIVGSTEANSLNGFISNESPLGIALLGKKKDAVVEVESPAGVIKYKILDIQNSL